MDWDEHRDQVRKFVDQTKVPGSISGSRALGELCYAMSELGLWGTDVKVDVELAVRVWQAVETARMKGFPKELWM